MGKIIIKDNIKYLLYHYENEDELETFVKKHIEMIFGTGSMFFEKNKIKSKAGIGSIPDGFVLSLTEDKWFIVEVELSDHPLYNHIVPQLTKFYSAIKNYATRRKLVDAFYDEIKTNIQLEYKFRSFGIKKELYKVLTDIINKTPDIVIIIDAKTKELEEICESLPFSVKVLVFETYYREGCNVPVHLCDTLESYPIYRKPPTQEGKLPPERQVTQNIFTKPTNKIEIILYNLYTPKRYALIPIPKKYRSFFPGYKVPFTLETDIGEIRTKVTSAPKGTEYGDPDAGNYIQGGLKPWYNKHRDLKEGDKLIIEMLEPKKKYRLDIEKSI